MLVGGTSCTMLGSACSSPGVPGPITSSVGGVQTVGGKTTWPLVGTGVSGFAARERARRIRKAVLEYVEEHHGSSACTV
jgi:hypothetical protein